MRPLLVCGGPGPGSKKTEFITPLEPLRARDGREKRPHRLGGGGAGEFEER